MAKTNGDIHIQISPMASLRPDRLQFQAIAGTKKEGRLKTSILSAREKSVLEMARWNN